MGNSAKTVADKLLRDKESKLLVTIDEHTTTKLNAILADAQDNVGLSKAKKKLKAAYSAYNKAESDYNDLAAQAKEDASVLRAEVNHKSQAMKDAIRSQVADIREQMWLGALTEDLRKKLNEVPTIEKLLGNGLSILKVSKKNIKLLPEYSGSAIRE